MPPHQCRFCGHANPDGAKYCNECGSQLNLKPCRLCDAINDVAAGHCHKCGAALPEQAAPALAPAAAVAARSGSVAPLREGEAEPAFSVGDADAIAGDADEARASDAPPDDRRPGVGTRLASRLAWVAAALAAVGIAAYLAYSPDRVDDVGAPSQAGPSDAARSPDAGGATSASPALPEPTPTATPSGASEQVAVDPGTPGSPSLATESGAETPMVGASSPASAMVAPGAAPGAQPLPQPTANAAATQAGMAKAKPKAKPKPKPKPKAKPKSQTAK